MIMSVRKGKRLISRLLPFLPSQQAAAVIMAIARNLPILAKKDKQDQVPTSPSTEDKVFHNTGSVSFLVWLHYRFYLTEQTSWSD